MDTGFVLAWEKNKTEIESYIRTHKQNEYAEYKDLVRLLFDVVINPEIKGADRNKYDCNDIKEIDNGDYQGTLIFILHKNCYQPSITDYMYTYVDYGSCSGCDTLMGIQDYNLDKYPTENQIKDYTTLLLHLLQRATRMIDYEE